MRIVVFFLLVTVAVSCGPTIVYESTLDVGDSWAYDEDLVYRFEVKDTAAVYQLEFVVHHGSSYPFQNLYVNVSTTYPEGKTVTDVVSLAVADRRGRYYGDCSGTDCKVPIQLLQNFKFKQVGTHTISIAQYSRKEDLSDVYGGTLRLVEATIKK